MAINANSLAGFLAVYSQESLKQFIAAMPKANLFTKNFDTEVANGGLSVTTRIPTTVWGAPNDLATDGWAGTAASSSAVVTTLKERNYDVAFNELEWATITPQVLQNLYMPSMIQQLANGIVVDAISQVTSSYYTNTITPNSSSTFTVTGSTSLQKANTTLSNLEIPEMGRYAIVSPNIYETLTAGVLPAYFYGDASAVQNAAPKRLLDFELVKYARFYGATAPQGGSKVGTAGTADKLVGICGNQQGLVMAARAPIDVNNGLVQSATATDETSGLSLQTRIVYDVSKPLWRLAVVSVYGVSRGLPTGIVPIITLSV